MTLDDSLKHCIIVNFVCAGLDHYDLLGCTCNCKVQIIVCSLLKSRIKDDLTVNKTNADAADRTVPGNIGDSDSNGSCDHAYDLGGIVGVNGKDCHNNGNVVAHILGEERSDRTVNHTGSKDSLFGRLALTLCKGARNSSHCIELFLIINGKREEVNTLSGLDACRNVCHYDCITVVYPAGTVGKLTGLACFNCKLAACISGLENLVVIEHFYCLL